MSACTSYRTIVLDQLTIDSYGLSTESVSRPWPCFKNPSIMPNQPTATLAILMILKKLDEEFNHVHQKSD